MASFGVIQKPVKQKKSQSSGSQFSVPTSNWGQPTGGYNPYGGGLPAGGGGGSSIGSGGGASTRPTGGFIPGGRMDGTLENKYGGGGTPLGGGGGVAREVPQNTNPTGPANAPPQGLPASPGGPLDLNALFQRLGNTPQGMGQQDYDRMRSNDISTARAQSGRNASDANRRAGAGGLTGAQFAQTVGRSALGATSGAEARSANREMQGKETAADREMQGRGQQLGIASLASGRDLGISNLGLQAELGRGDLGLRGELGRGGLNLDWARLATDADYRNRALGLEGWQAGETVRQGDKALTIDEIRALFPYFQANMSPPNASSGDVTTRPTSGGGGGSQTGYLNDVPSTGGGIVPPGISSQFTSNYGYGTGAGLGGRRPGALTGIK